MTVTELMVGDWVYVKDYPTIKNIQRIRPEHFVRSLVDFEPITLTTEILEKNEFYFDERRNAYIIGAIFQVKRENHGLFSFEICGCLYSLNTVHELQHALRLCGIDKEIEL